MHGPTVGSPVARPAHVRSIDIARGAGSVDTTISADQRVSQHGHAGRRRDLARQTFGSRCLPVERVDLVCTNVEEHERRSVREIPHPLADKARGQVQTLCAGDDFGASV